MSRGALEQLGRILFILPRASAEGGAVLSELAESLGTSRDQILEDLNQVLTRAFYHPASSGSALRVEIGAERIRAWTAGRFERPPTLSPREALAVALALRLRVAGGGDGEEVRSLARLLEERVAAAGWEEGAPDTVAFGGIERREDVRETLFAGAAQSRCCTIRYLSPDDEAPAERTVHPYAITHGDGRWYAIGHCEASAGIRIFRFDRVLGAELEGRGFTVPDDFDAAAYMHGGHVFQSGSAEAVTVLYDSGIARWIRERWDGTEGPDGAWSVEHQVADPDWLVSHVLGYGGDAEVLHPPAYRGLVRDVAERLGG